MATATITHHTSDGIHVDLFWSQLGSCVTVRVFDERTNDGFELEVDDREALDAFKPPLRLRST